MLYHAGHSVETAATPPKMKMKESILDKQDQLLVLGNGFDLQCGLKSAFADFMKTRKALMGEARANIRPKKYQSLYTGPDGPNGKIEGNYRLYHIFWEKGLTLWDFILFEDRQERTWYDVEECIRTWVDYSYSEERRSCSSHMKEIGRLREFPPRALPFPPLGEQSVYLYIRDLYQSDPTKWGVDSILSFLREELRHFEQAFAIYLLAQQEEYPTYKSKAKVLLSDLITDQLLPEKQVSASLSRPRELLESTSILNFNYTQPIPEYANRGPSMLNVHGLAGTSNVVFGIDGKNLDPNQDYYANTVKFSKTYRLMDLSSRPHRSLVRPYVAGSPGSATEVIKFFGHSLGDADYSYFQAIFDEVNLYESETRLIFYYNQNRPNGKGREKEVKEEMFEKVNRLITTYGATLDNEDHGRNLLHKLLLEGRLTIKQAPIER